MTTLELATLVHEPLRLAIPMPSGWSVHASDESDSLTIVGTDELGNDTLNPSIRVDRKGPPVPWREMAALADSSLGEMRSAYLEFHLHWSREMRDRVVRAYSYVHEDMGPVGQVQGIIAAGGVMLVTCSAPLETFERLMPTFEQIVTTVEKAPPTEGTDETVAGEPNRGEPNSD